MNGKALHAYIPPVRGEQGCAHVGEDGRCGWDREDHAAEYDPDLVERVAEALHDADPIPSDEGWPCAVADEHRASARAALAAMAEGAAWDANERNKTISNAYQRGMVTGARQVREAVEAQAMEWLQHSNEVSKFIDAEHAEEAVAAAREVVAKIEKGAGA